MPYIKSVVARVQHGYRLHQTLSRYFGVSLSRIPCGLRDWFRKAAEQGDAYAQSNLGSMYRNGQGVPQNYTQAADWYRKAATQGDSNALNNLGVMYENGEGITKNLVLAHMLYNLSAIDGYKRSVNNRDHLSKNSQPHN